MVVIILPDWVIKFEEKIDNLIRDLCNKENINYSFVHDSQTIKNAKENITMTLVNIQEKTEGNVPDKDFQDFKAMEKEIKKNERKRIKNK